jgi:hypothetical protein
MRSYDHAAVAATTGLRELLLPEEGVGTPLLARPGLVPQPLRAMVGIATPPKADNQRLDANFLGNR